MLIILFVFTVVVLIVSFLFANFMFGQIQDKFNNKIVSYIVSILSFIISFFLLFFASKAFT